MTHVTPDKINDVLPGSHDLYIRCDDGLKELGWNDALHPSHFYAIDTHIETDWRIKMSRGFDSVSVVHSSGLALDWGRTIGHDLFWIGVGCDPDKHSVGVKDKEYDGCAIMHFHNGLSGPRVDMLDAFFSECKGIFFGNRTFLDMAEKYAQSKLVFNRSINGDLNMRTWEAMCSGSCLVTDRVADLDKVGAVDGVHYAGYSDADELRRVVRDLLTDDAKREKIAAAGREFALSNTYVHRMKDLLESIQLNKQEKENGYALSR